VNYLEVSNKLYEKYSICKDTAVMKFVLGGEALTVKKILI